MPSSPSDIAKSAYLRALVLGEPFIGKTQTCMQTCEKSAYVIACDGESNLVPAARASKDFTYDLVIDDNPNILMNKMSACVSEAIKGAREGRYKTIFLDTITSYAERLEIGQEAAKNGGEDHGRSARKYHHNIASTIERLKMAPAHLVVLAHFIELEGGIMPGQEARKGKGIVPLLMGASRKTFGRRFDAIVMLEKKNSGERIFRVSTSAFFGLGARALTGTEEIPADLQLLWKKMQEGDAAVVKPPAKPIAPTKPTLSKTSLLGKK
jgi:hypothetical protein